MNPIAATNPPAFAEGLLGFFLKEADRACVPGDLLEEYREMIHAGRDPASADRWYVRQVLGFFWRSTWAWAAVLGLFTIGRTAMDVFDPPQSFLVRATATTYLHVATFLTISFHAAWRGRSFPDAMTTVFRVQIMAFMMIFVANVVFLAIWHDPRTLAAIERSGGFDEMFLLPLLVTGPAVVLSMIGGAAGVIVARFR